MKKVEEPTPEDFGNVLRSRISAATQPLRDEVRALQDELKMLEGRMDQISISKVPELRVGLLQKGSSIGAQLVFTTIDSKVSAVRKVIGSDWNKLTEAIEQMCLDKRDEAAFNFDASEWRQTDRRALDSISSAQLAQVKRFLRSNNIFLNNEEFNFDELWELENRYNTRTEISESDINRLKAFQNISDFAKYYEFFIRETENTAQYIEFSISVENISGVSAQSAKVTASLINPLTSKIMLFAPEKLPNQFSSMTGHIEYPEYLKNQIVPIRRFEQSFTEFLPKDFIHTKTFALFVGKPGLHQLSVEIKAREFPEPITQILEINIDFETPNE